MLKLFWTTHFPFITAEEERSTISKKTTIKEEKQAPNKPTEAKNIVCGNIVSSSVMRIFRLMAVEGIKINPMSETIIANPYNYIAPSRFSRANL